MERQIILSSFPLRNIENNRPGDFTTRFNPEIKLDRFKWNNLHGFHMDQYQFRLWQPKDSL